MHLPAPALVIHSGWTITRTMLPPWYVHRCIIWIEQGVICIVICICTTIIKWFVFTWSMQVSFNWIILLWMIEQLYQPKQEWNSHRCCCQTKHLSMIVNLWYYCICEWVELTESCVHGCEVRHTCRSPCPIHSAYSVYSSRSCLLLWLCGSPDVDGAVFLCMRQSIFVYLCLLTPDST